MPKIPTNQPILKFHGTSSIIYARYLFFLAFIKLYYNHKYGCNILTFAIMLVVDF